MERLQIGAVVVANRKLDGLDAIEIVIRESVQQTRLMARLDVKPLGNPHDQWAEQIDGDPAYLTGFAYGAHMMREWRERDCGRLIGSTAVTFRLKVPEEHSEDTIWCAGFYDGQALVYNLAVLSRLPACYVEVPELPAEYANASLAGR